MNTQTHIERMKEIEKALTELAGSRRAVNNAIQYAVDKRELLANLSKADRAAAKKLFAESAKIEKQIIANRPKGSLAAQICQGAATGEYNDDNEIGETL